MGEKLTIAVDALGGDNAPDAVLEGVRKSLEENKNLSIILCGPENVVVPFSQSVQRCEAVVTTEEITMEEHPAQAVRAKKDSSLVVAAHMVKDGRAQGFFSAGSTGAVLAAAMLIVGRIKGVSRPMLATVLPAPSKPVVLCDVGANSICKPEYLVQFAQMGCAYMRGILQVDNPKVALLNIGEEETKGSDFAIECHNLLKENVPEFVGNAEGRDLLTGEFDLIVTDGFTGNVCLKTIEGTASILFKEIKKVMKATPLTMLGALTMKKGLMGIASRLSADTYGGAPLIGVKGACVVGHGSSNAQAVCNGILYTAKAAEAHIEDTIALAMKDSHE